MAFALIGSVALKGSGPSGAIDTTGANLIVVVHNALAGGISVSDSKSNTYTNGTYYTPDYSTSYTRLAYCLNPTTGSTTWSTTQSFQGVAVFVFSGAAAASVLDQASGNNGAASGTTINASTGTVTPTEDNELIVAGMTSNVGISDLSVNGGFTVLANSDIGGGAYLIQTTATGVNPQFSWTGSSQNSAAIMTFKAAAGGGSAVPLLGQNQQMNRGVVSGSFMSQKAVAKRWGV